MAMLLAPWRKRLRDKFITRINQSIGRVSMRLKSAPDTRHPVETTMSMKAMLEVYREELRYFERLGDDATEEPSAYELRYLTYSQRQEAAMTLAPSAYARIVPKARARAYARLAAVAYEFGSQATTRNQLAYEKMKQRKAGVK